MTKKFTATVAPIADQNPGQGFTMSGTVIADSAADAGTFNIVFVIYNAAWQCVSEGAIQYGKAINETAPLAVSADIALPADAPAETYTGWLTVRDPSTWTWQTVSQTPASFCSPGAPVVASRPFRPATPLLTYLRPVDPNANPLDGSGYLPDTGDDWTLIEAASDEFDGNSLDTEKWWRRHKDNQGTLDHYNNELQRYNDAHVVSGGSLKMIARVNQALGSYKAPNGNIFPMFDSQMIRSRMLFKYGYVEARMKLPPGVGVWPAFWGLPQTSWCPEQDWLEYVNNTTTDHPYMVHNNNRVEGGRWNECFWHDQDYNIEYGYFAAWGKPTYFIDDYVTISAYWNELDDTDVVYVDGEPVSHRNVGPSDQISAIFNLAIGDAWATGNGDKAWTVQPSTTDQVFEVSHFRLWQKSDKIITGTSPV